jgi:hypothetical protein
VSTLATRSTGSSTPADNALDAIRREIEVPIHVLKEAQDRRNFVLEIADQHEATRAVYASGSVAHGTTNKPLEDADCGNKVNRRYEIFRRFGPDGDGESPEEFIQLYADFILRRLIVAYPNATVDLGDNKRSIPFKFNQPVEFDDWGQVDPYVDFIVGLERVDAPGIWIPNRETAGWDPADPELHTKLMTGRDPKPLRVNRARLLRLAKRAVKRDATNGGRAVMCSWNLSALALELVKETAPIAAGLATFLRGAAESIALRLTEDPAPAVEEPIGLPDGVTQEFASDRLHEMADIVERARRADTSQAARLYLAELYGPEVEAIRERDDQSLRRANRAGDASALGSALGLSGAQKVTRSDGA